ncbi:CPBP family intramembrane glutamic endopeptidase [Homoserinibacter sp. GY 40078]|uniref:CPBP family intramembrane glutamic endopeptidase n=1 Tax=Homoserinibacter sp. GY 40078 TaxID=2603275 RepID=UPI0011CAB575|nr:type II CAAX endopeptidase family protein [Homoserinibacter sp. GY 40078]TXK16360.1 CPBP family intramembrane metalloprotease [Homoserinibacter sp. GY 40078]
MSETVPATPAAERRRPGGVAVFLVVAFLVTWAIWLPILVEAQTVGLDEMPWTFFLASMGPLCGAVAAAAWEGGGRGIAAWARRAFSVRFRWVWWLAGVGMPLAYLAIAWVTVFAVEGSWPDAGGFGLTEKLSGLAWPLVALVWVLTFGLGEESGWRGWLLPALSRRMSPFWAALVVGGVWIAWHAPAFFFNPTYMEMGAGIVGWMLALVCGSFLLAWMTLGAGGSIVPVLLWHAGFDLLTAADQAAGLIASTISAIVMAQGVLSAWLLWRHARRSRAEAGRGILSEAPAAHPAAREKERE